ncbi:hypothetical protein GG851_23470 [Bordetella petrii]|nr:hypothetical protein [Bordetella petrii]
MSVASVSAGSDMQELLEILSRNRIRVPDDRLDLILAEYRLLRDQMNLLERQLDSGARAHIMTAMAPAERP